MRIEIYQGCFGKHISIDNKKWEDFLLDEKKEILKKFIDSIEDNSQLEYTFEDLIQNATEFKVKLDESDICEQCGNHNYTLEYEN